MIIVFRYILLIVILLNIPMFSLFILGATFGSLSSALLFGGIILYFFVSKKPKPILPLIILGIIYFTISLLNYSGIFLDFLKDAIRYFIFIIGAVAIARDTNTKELSIVLLIGALSVLINALVFPNHYGRYSGLFINPNRAGLICLIGFVFSYTISNRKIRLILQFLFTIAGIMTLSRYFILMLVVINLVSILSNKKNIIGFGIGAIAIITIFAASSLQLNSERFSAFQSIFSDNVDTQTITKGSRSETWAKYTDVMLDNALVGVGYRKFHGGIADSLGINVGVHNTYLMALGEAGVLAFLLLIIIYFTLIIRSIKQFNSNPEYLYLAIVLSTFLLVSHNYFDNYMILFPTIWLYLKLNNKPNENILIQN